MNRKQGVSVQIGLQSTVRTVEIKTVDALLEKLGLPSYFRDITYIYRPIPKSIAKNNIKFDTNLDCKVWIIPECYSVDM